MPSIGYGEKLVTITDIKIFNRIGCFVAELATSSENIFKVTVIDKYIYRHHSN